MPAVCVCAVCNAIDGAHNALLDLEELEEADLEKMRARFEAPAEAARGKLLQGGRDDDCPET